MSASGKAGIQGLVHHLSAWAREELAIQTELQAALDEQVAAVRERGPERMEAATDRIDAAHEHALQSDRRRAKLYTRFADCWGVGPTTLTLGSIVLRAGEDAGPLAELRADLHAAATGVQATARQAGAVLRMHRRIASEVLGTILGQDENGNIKGSGALLSTEA